MKYAVIVLALSTLGFAKDAHVASRTVKYVATASPVRYVKDAGKGGYFLLKQATFPVRHPKRSAHGAYHGVAKSAKQVF